MRILTLPTTLKYRDVVTTISLFIALSFLYVAYCASENGRYVNTDNYGVLDTRDGIKYYSVNNAIHFFNLTTGEDGSIPRWHK